MTVIRGSDQRRRRVVLDEVSLRRSIDSEDAPLDEAASEVPKSVSSADSRLYTFAAQRRNLLKTTDLIPKRFYPFSVVVLALLVCFCLLNFLAFNAMSWRDYIGHSGSRAFALTGSGSLSNWFSSFLLIMTGLASLQIYALRKHRCDDYKGTYQLWLWMAALLLLASVNCVVDFKQIFTNVLEAVTQKKVVQTSWALITFKLVALTLLVVRGLFEVRSSKGAFAMVVLVWLSYAATIVLQIPAVQDGLVVSPDYVRGNLLLFGTGCLFLAHLTYARNVYLLAHGLIKTQVKTKPVASVAESTGLQREPVAQPKPNQAEVKTQSLQKTQSTAKSKKSPSQPKRAKPVPKPSQPVAQKPRNKKQEQTRQPSKKAVNDLKALVAASNAAKKTKPAVPKPDPQADQGAEILSFSDEQLANMSKSERRRARKLQKRQNRAA